MSDLAPERNIIQEQETQPKASTSTSLLSRMGASSNFILAYMHQEKMWTANGRYNAVTGPQIGIDGGIPIIFDMLIVGISMWNLVPGTSGLLEFDIKRHTASNQAGTSIFTTTPKLSFSSGINSFLTRRFTDNVDLESPTGATMPVLLSQNLDAGDLLTCDILQKQVAGESGGILINLRPR